MKFISPSNFIKLTAVLLVLYCFVLIMLPEFTIEKLGIASSPTGTLFMQFLGASLGGHAYLNWRAAEMDLRLLRPVIIMNIVALTLAVIISLIPILRGTASTPGLLILVMHLVVLLGFILARKGLH